MLRTVGNILTADNYFNMKVLLGTLLFAIHLIVVNGQSTGSGGDFANFLCNSPKYGSCPSEGLINPSFYPCVTDRECSGGRLCCGSNYANTATAQTPPITGLKYCSDIRGSKQYLTCPASSISTGQNKTKCYTDANCGNGNLKCCASRFNGDCNSYCVAGEQNCYNLPNKPDGLCPRVELYTNPTIYCSSNDQCPGNWVCCYGKAGKTCSRPQLINPGTCPTPFELLTAGARQCFSDKDCGEGICFC
uniref:WAP domain-containing protein n=1 Tax=Strigamia maritima TaxID=126957 RepID=T1J2D8_STRMM